MPLVNFDIDTPDFQELSKRAIGRAQKRAGIAAMEWFQRERLHKRFDGSLSAELRFEQRDEWYEEFKGNVSRTRGRELRFRGKTAARARRGNIRVTRQVMQVVITGLNDGFARRRKSTVPDMQSEIQRFTEGEQETIAEIYAEKYQEEIEVEIELASRRKRKV